MEQEYIDALRAQAEADGAALVAYNPKAIDRLVDGTGTLAEVYEIDKSEMYEAACTAQRCLGEGKVDSALKMFESLTMLNPFDAYHWLGLGTALYLLERLEEALPALSQAVAINPACSPAFAVRGEIYLRMEDLEAARADFVSAIAEDKGAEFDSTARAQGLLGLLDQPSQAPVSRSASATQ